eukprot:CAMPEP_0201281430 /NCGR_PEP_ID=MMETSP1317-20130820/2736_1 /ASSEMBLY_ACC=CAM_ASM_000770 /TAXON_ID=187299 /ORGANISM="Undescribed Undescribed, Strain Undescribed" /LENGTH=107 /DNA_ID=CAMNT_0047591205 /DNA_START=885 /DNA_END=1208 /DNA_ORIENTATION=-
MSTFGSYKKVNGPIIEDAFFIAIVNYLVSFLAGFVVFGALGRLSVELGIPISSLANTDASIIFVGYVRALDLFDGANGWCIIFFLTLVLLGVSSAFSIIEAFTNILV